MNLSPQYTPEKSEIFLAVGHSPYHSRYIQTSPCKHVRSVYSRLALLIAYAHYIMKQSFMIVIYTRFARQSLLYHKSFLCANRISCILAEHFLCNRNEFSQYIKKTFCISESLSVHYINFFIHGNQYAVRPAILLLSEHCRSSWKTYNH